MWTVAGGGLPPKIITISNVRFDSVVGASSASILMGYDAGDGRNVIQRDEVFVYDYNGTPGDNFQLYYFQQADTFVVPQTGSNSSPSNPVIGAPVAGLTNLETWNLFGIAIAGAIAPTSDTRDGVFGLIRRAAGVNLPAVGVW
jgi:hypothetical protein